MKAKILLTLDGSNASIRAAEYVAKLLGGQPEVSVVLFHTLVPVPPALLEAGTFEQEPQLEQQRAQWLKAEQAVECDILDPVREMLKKAGFSSNQIVSKCHRLNARSDVASEILNEARQSGCDTIVLGKRGHSRIAEFLTGSITEKVVRHAKNFAVWVID